MSFKKAQGIVNELYHKYGIDILAYQNDEISDLKNSLEEFVELGVDTDELVPPDDCELDLDDLDEEEETEC